MSGTEVLTGTGTRAPIVLLGEVRAAHGPSDRPPGRGIHGR